MFGLGKKEDPIRARRKEVTRAIKEEARQLRAQGKSIICVYIYSPLKERCFCGVESVDGIPIASDRCSGDFQIQTRDS